MLFTRCPECDTTFRITADALRKADGQVRCGRCACVFNAYAELRRGTSEAYCDDGVVRKTLPAEPPPPAAADDAAGAKDVAAAAADDAEDVAADDADDAENVAAADDGAAQPDDRPEPPLAEEEGEPLQIFECATFIADVEPTPEELARAEAAFDGVTLANVIDELEASAAGDTLGSSAASEADAPAAAAPSAAPTWIVLEGEASERPSRKWAFGCIAAALLLAVQITHHYRTQLAATAIVGPWLRNAYAFLGSEIAPHWDLAQYEILDWTAIAEPDAEGEGTLTIAARLYNRGPRTQPFPHVQVQLKDRWEQTVGSRIFSPSEYLSGATGHAEMHAGRTARAELSIVDPGPDAYGFELDVCIPRHGGELRCAADEVFR